MRTLLICLIITISGCATVSTKQNIAKITQCTDGNKNWECKVSKILWMDITPPENSEFPKVVGQKLDIPVAVGVEMINEDTGKTEEKVILGTATFTLQEKMKDGSYLYQQTQSLGGGVITSKTCVHVTAQGKATQLTC